MPLFGPSLLVLTRVALARIMISIRAVPLITVHQALSSVACLVPSCLYLNDLYLGSQLESALADL